MFVRPQLQVARFDVIYRVLKFQGQGMTFTKIGLSMHD